MENTTFADLYTPEGEALSGQPWSVYPRPQLRRDSFLNLNGTWDFTLSASPEPPAEDDQNILVPYAPNRFSPDSISTARKISGCSTAAASHCPTGSGRHVSCFTSAQPTRSPP